MTLTDFVVENCTKCSSLHCPQTREAVSTCDKYKGNIKGIEKKESIEKYIQRIKEAFEIHKVIIISGGFNIEENQKFFFDKFLNKLKNEEHRQTFVICDTNEVPINDKLLDEIKRFSQHRVFFKTTLGNLDLIDCIKYNANSDALQEIELIGYDIDKDIIANALILKTAFPEIQISTDVSYIYCPSIDSCIQAIKVMENCGIKIKGLENNT